MVKLNNNESGFNIIEVTLIIVIVVILSLVGWYVWHIRDNNNSVAPKISPTPTSIPPATTNAPPSGTTSPNYACVNEGLCPQTNGIKSGAK